MNRCLSVRVISALCIAILLGTTPAVRARVQTANKSSAPTDVNPITQITVEHAGCYGTCPAYAVTVNADGSAMYEGYDFVPRKGTYVGTFRRWKRIVEAIKRDGFFNMQKEYASLVTDADMTYTIVVRKDGSKKVVLDYAGAGPQALWEIETMIDGVVANTDWQLKDANKPTLKHF